MDKINKGKILKRAIKELPFRLGARALAIIVAIGDGVIETFESAAEGNLTMGKVYEKITKSKTIQDYYEEIKNLREDNFRVTLWRLQEKGLVEKKKNSLRLSLLGLKYFEKIKKNNSLQKWDNKWRIVMFDIPENLKRERNWLRGQLCNLEYKSFQKSVFIGKYPLKEDLFKEITARRLNKYVNLITVGEIDDEQFSNKK